jgi:glycosyltransferase involved in cell wall biosynthesis
MSLLRVLHVTPYCGEAWAYGGIPRVVDASVRALAERGHQVEICATDACSAASRLRRAPRRFRRWPPIPVREGVTLHVFPNLSNRAAYYAQLFLPVGLGSFLRRHARRFDVAHVHACRNLPGTIAARELRRAGVPVVLAPNGTAPLVERRRRAKRLFDGVFGRVLDSADVVLAVTAAEERQLQQLGVPAARVRLVPNPVSLEEFDAPARRGVFRATLGLDATTPVVVFLGKLTPRKRVDVLIRAFRRLLAATPSLAGGRLVIAGNDMGAGGAARTLARTEGVDGRVTFCGLLEGRHRLEVLADADVVVYPGEDEIFGLVPLEALLTGAPVIVAGDSGCGEVIAAMGGGPIVAAGDVAALSAAMGEVLANPDSFRAKATAAAPLVRERYGSAAVAATLEGLYRELAAARRS